MMIMPVCTIHSLTTSSLPLPEPVSLENEGAFLKRHTLGLYKEEAHKGSHHCHANGEEKESCPLQDIA